MVLVHGGPGAPGYLAPVARRLAGSFRVLEPMQRRSGPVALTVARHVEDLAELIATRCAGEPPALVGHSWGAMLALAFAAARPRDARCLVLIGCGTFDPGARRRLRARIDQEMDERLRRRLASLAAEIPDPDERLRATAELLLPLYSHDPVTTTLDVEGCDAKAYEESWEDMIRLQSEKVYPDAFQAIRAPVLMLHGSRDPHPGDEVRASLETHLPQLQYHVWPRCGHYPWIERAVGEEFFEMLESWLQERLGVAQRRGGSRWT